MTAPTTRDALVGMASATGAGVLLPYQARWHEEEASVAIMEKGRRTGISWTTALTAAEHARDDLGHVYYQSFNRDMTRSWIEKAAAWLYNLRVAELMIEELDFEDPDEDGREVRTYRIKLPNGRRIEALESSPRAVRSKGDPGDMYILDEAAFVGRGTSRAAKQEHLSEVLKSALAIPMWGGRVRIISTHDGEDSAFCELVRDAKDGRLNWAHHKVTLDDAIRDGLVEAINEVTGASSTHQEFRAECFEAYTSEDAANEELLCIPRRSAGVYLPRALVESCQIEAPILRFPGTDEFNAMPKALRQLEMGVWLQVNVAPVLAGLTPERLHVIGFDFARSGHLSVLAPLELHGHQRRCPFLIEMRHTPHSEQVQAILYVAKRLPRFAGGALDATGAGSYVAEAVADEYGQMIEQVVFNVTWWREQMPRYKAHLEGRTVRIPKDDDVLEDHRSVELVRGVPGLPGGAGKDRHGDSAVALALACQAADQGCGPFDYQSAGRAVGAGDWREDFVRGRPQRPGAATGLRGFAGSADLRGFA